MKMKSFSFKFLPQRHKDAQDRREFVLKSKFKGDLRNYYYYKEAAGFQQLPFGTHMVVPSFNLHSSMLSGQSLSSHAKKMHVKTNPIITNFFIS